MNLIGHNPNAERPRIVAFGGGKGGTGRSTMCAEIARSLARQGQRILCVDASYTCPTLNAFLSAPEPSFDLDEEVIPLGEEDSHLADFIQETGIRNIWLVSLAPTRQYPFVRPRLQADLFIAQLQQLDFDLILLDLPPELDPFPVGLFTLSDVPIIVCTPEPAAVRMATQYLRSALFQAIATTAATHHARDEIFDFLYEQPLQLNLDTLADALEHAPSLTRALEETLLSFQVYLIVNLVREGAERDLGFVLAHAWYQELGIFPRFLTPIDYEDRRWFYNRRTTGLTSTRGDEALSNDIERLVRALTQIETIDLRYPRPVPVDPNAPTALQLGLSADTNPNLVRQHCRRLWEGYRREATVALAFSDPEERARMAESIELLYKRSLNLPGETSAPDPATLSTPRHASDKESEGTGSGAPKGPPSENSPPSRERMRTPAAMLAPSGGATPLSLPSVGGVRPEQSPGRLVERLRRQQGISLGDLSQRTHIGLKYLAAIEDADLEILPRSVYLRGYLREIARVFSVDPDHLVLEYFRLLEILRANSGAGYDEPSEDEG